MVDFVMERILTIWKVRLDLQEHYLKESIEAYVILLTDN
jgi:hypothetical protein